VTAVFARTRAAAERQPDPSYWPPSRPGSGSGPARIPPRVALPSGVHTGVRPRGGGRGPALSVVTTTSGEARRRDDARFVRRRVVRAASVRRIAALLEPVESNGGAELPAAEFTTDLLSDDGAQPPRPADPRTSPRRGRRAPLKSSVFWTTNNLRERYPRENFMVPVCLSSRPSSGRRGTAPSTRRKERVDRVERFSSASSELQLGGGGGAVHGETEGTRGPDEAADDEAGSSTALKEHRGEFRGDAGGQTRRGRH
jgi:hypothetical protein